MMDDLISRAAAIAKVEKARKAARTLTGMDFVMMLKDQPAVNAAPVVHGRWETITHGFPPEPSTVCSNCGLDIDYEICKRIKADSFSYTSIRPSYCPQCGAKMDGDT